MRKRMISLTACVALFAVGCQKTSSTEQSGATSNASETIVGWVVDSKCPKMGKNGGDPPDAECTKKCLKSGAKMTLVKDSDETVLTIENPGILEGYEGAHVQVFGRVRANSLLIEKLQM